MLALSGDPPVGRGDVMGASNRVEPASRSNLSTSLSRSSSTTGRDRGEEGSL